MTCPIKLDWFRHSPLHATAHPGYSLHYEVRGYPGEDRRWETLVWQGSLPAETLTEFAWTGNVDDMFSKAAKAAEADLDRRMSDLVSGPASADAMLTDLFFRALHEAKRAMQKFPQPNYNITKVAEECGEVVKAAVHCAEGRDTPEHVTAEIRQAMAMLIRLYVEGDQVHGLAPLLPKPSHEVAA